MARNKKTLKEKTAVLFKFLKSEIWRIRLEEQPRQKSFFIRLIRIIILAFRGFIEDKVQLRASALTYYSLLSIVPVAAMAFGIAKGFGFEKRFESQVKIFINSRFSYASDSDSLMLDSTMIDTSNTVVLSDTLVVSSASGKDTDEMKNVLSDNIIEFANNMLESAKGGLLAGIGIVILMWAVMKVLGNIEESFNEIWKIKKPRAFARKFTDYLSMMLIAPVLVILSSSAQVYIAREVKSLTQSVELLDYISPFIFFLIKLIPYVLVWILFSMLYIIMPNTKVSFKSGIIAGFIAGTIFQFLQWIYIYFQIGVSRYGAIYGGFAALPLFLIWLHFSWIIVLFGAEISFANQNVHKYEFESDSKSISFKFRKLMSLLISNMVIKGFEDGKDPLSAPEISRILKIPIRVVREVIFELVECNIFTEIQNDRSKERLYQPALDINKISIDYVLMRIENRGSSNINISNTKEFQRISETLSEFGTIISKSSNNILVKDI